MVNSASRSTHTRDNSPVETLWVGIAQLDRLSEVTEAEAKAIHPALFEYLALIDAGVA